jgi:hypothetical protein
MCLWRQAPCRRLAWSTPVAVWGTHDGLPLLLLALLFLLVLR